MKAAGQNLKRLLKKRGWGRRPFPAEASYAFFLAAYWWLTRPSLTPRVDFLVLGYEQEGISCFFLMSFERDFFNTLISCATCTTRFKAKQFPKHTHSRMESELL